MDYQSVSLCVLVTRLHYEFLPKIAVIELHFNNLIHYVLLKALLQVCMKYTAQGESQVVNIARGEAECYIFVTRLSPRAVSFIQMKCQCFMCFIVLCTN